MRTYYIIFVPKQSSLVYIVKTNNKNVLIKDKRGYYYPNYKLILDLLINNKIIKGVESISEIFTKLIPKSILLNGDVGKKYIDLLKSYRETIEQSKIDVNTETLFESSLYKEILNDFFGDVEVITNKENENLIAVKLTSLLERTLINQNSNLFNPSFKDYLINRYVAKFLKENLSKNEIKNNQLDELISKLPDNKKLTLVQNIHKLLYDFFTENNISNYVNYDVFKEFVNTIKENKKFDVGYVKNYILINVDKILTDFEEWLKKNKQKAKTK